MQVGRNEHAIRIDHTYLMSGPSNDGWKDGPWSVVAGKASLAHTGPIVHDQCGNFVVTHDVLGFGNLVDVYERLKEKNEEI